LGTRPGGTDLSHWGQNSNNHNQGNDNNDNDNSGGVSARGITVETLTSDLAQQINVPASVKGVVVSDVDQTGPAAEAGIGRGVVITAVNRHPVATAQDFKRMMNDANGKPVLLTVNQGGQSGFVVVQPQ
jgi:serine protease Do